MRGIEQFDPALSFAPDNSGRLQLTQLATDCFDGEAEHIGNLTPRQREFKVSGRVAGRIARRLGEIIAVIRGLEDANAGIARIVHRGKIS